MGKIINDDENLYFGKVGLNINIGSISAGELSYPINLNYQNFNGNQVDELPTVVGLGWDLNAIGSVSRIQNGMPDECRNIYYKTEIITIPQVETISSTVAKLLDNNYNYFQNTHILKNSQWNKEAYISSLLENVDYKVDLKLTLEPYGGRFEERTTGFKPALDLMPDVFHFSVGNYSGSFFLNYDGIWTAIGNDNRTYDVEVIQKDNYSVTYRTVNELQTSSYKIPRIIEKIILISSDGAKLTFGGDESSIEYSFYSASNLYPEPSMSNYASEYSPIVPSRWLIKKIEHLNNKDYLEFDYDIPEFKFTVSTVPYGLIAQTGSSYARYYLSTNRDRTPVDKIAFKYSPLREIRTSRGDKIIFSYSNSIQTLYNKSFIDGYYDFSAHNIKQDNDYYKTNHLLKLDTILFYSNVELVDKVIFGYNENSGDRLKLASLTMKNGIEKGYFYYNETKLPKQDSREKDHFGYYNHSDFFAKIDSFSSWTNEILNGTYHNSREPNLNYAMAEVLESVVLNTGKTISFEYEQNDYSTLIDQELKTVKYNKSYLGGGLRVKEVKEYDNNILVNHKQYSYIRDDGFSSGVIDYHINYLKNYNPTEMLYHFTFDRISPGTFENVISAYSQVIITENNKGKTKLSFSNHDNGYKDLSPVLSKNIDVYRTINNLEKHKKLSGSQWFKRGKKISEVIYDSKDSIISNTTYKYEHNFTEQNKINYRSVYLYRYGDTRKFSAIEYPIYPDYIREVSTEHKFNDKKVTTVNNLKYNSVNNQILDNDTYSSDNKIVKISNKFVTDYRLHSGFTGSVYGKMNERKLLSIPIETIIRRNDKVIEATLNEFTEREGIIVLQRVYKLDAVQGLGDFKVSKIENGYLLRDNRYVLEKEIVNTDMYGNILAERKPTGITQAYVWGYQGKYKLAEIQNVNYADIEKVLTTQTIAALNSVAVSDAIITSAISKLRSDSRLSKAMVTSYTYKLGIGVKTKTDPRGVKESYDYDSFGRLVAVNDLKDNITKAFLYNYAGTVEPLKVYRNIVKSKVFVKNNCSAGQIAASITYTVPSRKYSSTISQAAADQLAQADINANGQNYANTNGGCKVMITSTNIGLVEDVMGTMILIGPENIAYKIDKSGSNSTITVPPGQYSIKFATPGTRALFEIGGETLRLVDLLSGGEVSLGSYYIGSSYSIKASRTYYSNSAMTRNFVKNNCPSGLLGSTEAYAVSANVYYSFISQADADQKASNEITDRGQNAANSRGTCKSLVAVTLLRNSTFNINPVSVEFIPSGQSNGSSFTFPTTNGGTSNQSVAGGNYVLKFTLPMSVPFSIPIYLNGSQIGSIPGGLTSYSVSANLPEGTSHVLRINITNI